MKEELIRMKTNANRVALLEYEPVNGRILGTSFSSKMQYISVELEKRRSDLSALLHVSEARAREAQENAREIGALIDEAEAMINEAHDKYISAETRLRQEAALRVLAERKLKDLKEDLRSYPNLDPNTRVYSPRATSVPVKPRAETRVIHRDKTRPVVVVKPEVNEGMRLIKSQLAKRSAVKLASFGTLILLILIALFLLIGIDIQAAH
jgi:chromosome segregation ATPase